MFIKYTIFNYMNLIKKKIQCNFLIFHNEFFQLISIICCFNSSIKFTN